LQSIGHYAIHRKTRHRQNVTPDSPCRDAFVSNESIGARSTSIRRVTLGQDASLRRDLKVNGSMGHERARPIARLAIARTSPSLEFSATVARASFALEERHDPQRLPVGCACRAIWFVGDVHVDGRRMRRSRCRRKKASMTPAAVDASLPPSGNQDASLIPNPDRCGNGIDDDHNGLIDDKCSCASGSTQRCYAGKETSMGVGTCTAGTQKCSNGGEFGTWGIAWAPSPEARGLRRLQRREL